MAALRTGPELRLLPGLPRWIASVRTGPGVSRGRDLVVAVRVEVKRPRLLAAYLLLTGRLRPQLRRPRDTPTRREAS